MPSRTPNDDGESESESETEPRATDSPARPQSTIDRRALLVSGATVVGGGLLAGCTGDGDDGGDGTTTGGDETTAGDGDDETTSGGDGTTTGGDGTTTDGDETTTSGGGGGTTNIAIVSSPAGFDDSAFNDLALEGLEAAAEDHDIEINQVEEQEPSNYQSTQSQLAQGGEYDLIVLVSYDHTEALSQNAVDYPDQNWMLINDHVDEPNVAGYTWANHEMSYLAGVLGGTMTTEELSHEGSSTAPETAQIGFVGGADESLINAFEQAYQAGAEWVNEDVEVNVGYIGNYSDTGTASDIASSHYDDGADIVFHAAAAAGSGVFQAAQENDRFAIGVDADQSVSLDDYQDVIIGSAVKYINEGTREVANAVVADDFESVAGATTLGLEEEAVACVIGQAFEGDLPDVVGQNLDDATQGILDGDIEVPCTASGCN